MQREQVRSSDIKSVGYDKESSILEIEFRSGSVYQYANVAENVYSEFLASDSLGRYFNSHIRDSYQGFKV